MSISVLIDFNTKNIKKMNLNFPQLCVHYFSFYFAYRLLLMYCVVLCHAVLCCPCRELRVVSGDKTKVVKYSSLGLDGAMVIWEFKVHIKA